MPIITAKDGPTTIPSPRSGAAPRLSGHAWSGAWLCAIGPQGVLMLPLILGGFTRIFPMTNAETGFLASATLLGCCLIAFVQAVMFRIFSQRSMTLTCLSVLLISFGLLFIVTSYALALLVMLLVGAGMGGLLVLGFTAAAQSGQQTRVTALGIVAQGTIASSIAWIASLFPGTSGAHVLYGLLALSAIAGFAAVPGMPRHAIALPMEDGERPSKPSIALVLALLAWGLINMANGGFWPLIERVAAADGISAGVVGRAISYSSIAGVVAALVALMAGTRIGQWFPLLLIGAGTIVSVLMIVAHPSAQTFAIAMTLFGFLWGFGPPYQVPIIAGVDSVGNGMAYSILIMKVSMAIVPAVYGLVADGFGFFAVGILASLFAILSTIMFSAALMHGQRHRRQVRSSH